MQNEKNLLINFTNHPSNLWSEEQKTAALQKWSEIIDIPFPMVSPDWGEVEVRETFEKFYSEVKEKCTLEDRDLKNADFLVMGEFRLTFYTVTTLIKLGHKVFSHSGRRDVEIKENKSIYTFRFGRFVEYFSN